MPGPGSGGSSPPPGSDGGGDQGPPPGGREGWLVLKRHKNTGKIWKKMKMHQF